MLKAANGTPIFTFGQKDIPFVVAGTRYVWNFIVAKVSRPLVGADFLRHSGLLVDVRRRRLVQADSGSTASLSSVSSRAVPTISVVQPSNPYVSWLRDDYPELIRPTFSDNDVKHGVTLPIPTTSPPVFAKARRLSPDKLVQAKKAFQSMLESGIVRRSDSAWSSPLHLVEKEDGSWRPCGDFLRLNARTTPDKYPVPHLQDFSAQLHGCEFFSKIDLVRGYHQIPVAPEDVHKTAVRPL